MYRVLSTSVDHRGRSITEAGPWFETYEQAKFWGELLRRFGYAILLENQHGKFGLEEPDPEKPREKKDDELLAALASMA
ncbi:MAG: hypothetical protein LBL69_06700 [Zoogloeaceae bacterium]|jgi:hypothetical protein|nr:hypothetical protein [Zoogloeaceae bacterium]